MAEYPALPAPIDAEVIDDPLESVHEEISELQHEVKELRAQIAKMLAWMSGLRAAVNGGQAPANVPADSSIPQLPNEAAWRAWKERLPGPCSRIIDALMIQPLTQTQIATQARIHTSNVSKYMNVLRGNGLLDQDGSKWRLKKL